MRIDRPDVSVVTYSPKGKSQPPAPSPKFDFLRHLPSHRIGEDLGQFQRRIAAEERSILTIAERLEKDLFRYSLNKRDKSKVSTITLFYVPDKIRDCVPFVAKASNAPNLPGSQAVYCCALERGREMLEGHHLLAEYLAAKERSVPGEHKGTRHETTTRKAIEAPTFNTPRENSRVIVPVSHELKDGTSSFTGAYNVPESPAGYLFVLAGLSEEPAVASVTREWMKEQLEMFWEDIYLKTASLNLRMGIIEKWEKGGEKPW